MQTPLYGGSGGAGAHHDHDGRMRMRLLRHPVTIGALIGLAAVAAASLGWLAPYRLGASS